MIERVSPRRRGSYGIDAPYAPAFLTGLAAVYLVLAVISGRLMDWLALAFILAVDAAYLYTTLRGKFVVWAGAAEPASEAATAKVHRRSGRIIHYSQVSPGATCRPA
jgi:hypothetical protein